MKTDKSSFITLTHSLPNRRALSVDALYSLFFFTRTPDFFFGGECHAPWEMVYVVRGRVGVSADDRVYSLAAGDIIFHQPMEFHKIWSEDGSSPQTLIASFDLSGPYVHRLRGSVFHLTEEPLAILSSLLAVLGIAGAEAELPQSISYTEKETLPQTVFPLLEALLLSLTVTEQNPIDTQKGEMERLYTAIVTLLEKNLTGKITVAQIASALGISETTAKSCFASYAGTGIHKYFLKLKLRTAIELLRDGHTVSEVSDRLGFANPNYFGIVFKRETGKTPGSFRVSGQKDA